MVKEALLLCLCMQTNGPVSRNKQEILISQLEVDVSVVSVSICAMIFQLNTGVCMISIYFKFQVIIFIRSKVMLILVVSNMYKKGDSFQMTCLFISTAEQIF